MYNETLRMKLLQITLPPLSLLTKLLVAALIPLHIKIVVVVDDDDNELEYCELLAKYDDNSFFLLTSSGFGRRSLTKKIKIFLQYIELKLM